jgi:hypothetical protein
MGEMYLKQTLQVSEKVTKCTLCTCLFIDLFYFKIFLRNEKIHGILL